MSDEEIREEQGSPEELAELAGLRQFEGAPAEFWAVFVSVSSRLIGAEKGVLILDEQGEGSGQHLKKIGEWPKKARTSPATAEFMRQLAPLVQDCQSRESLAQPIFKEDSDGASGFALAVKLKLEGSTAICVAAYALVGVTKEQAEEALMRIRLASDVPQSYQTARAVIQAREDMQKFATVMDLLAEVNAARRFGSAAIALCNAIATRFQCDRVSLGWIEGGFVRVKAISRTEKFDKHQEAVRNLEVAMEECADQDDEIIWPAWETSTVVTRDHEAFSKDQKVDCLCSVPLRDDDEAVAVLTCERGKDAFVELEAQQLRLICDFASRLICDMKERDRWFGARWASGARKKLAWVVGAEHTWAKVLAVVLTIAVACMIFVKAPYRVEAEFILRSDEVAYLTTPFPGYISEVHAKPGDEVKAGQTLLTLNKEDLFLQEAENIAELNRHNREVERARAASRLAEMRVAQAQADQAEARLKLVRYRLERSEIKAPFDGVVVEGDPRQRIGAALSAGDSLFRIARTDSLYVEAEVPERDIHETLDRVDGEIAFVSQPEHKFPVKVSLVESAAMPKEEGAVFIVRCDFPESAQEWWRPGMSGLCKINIGKRRLIWIFTHRTVDFFRMWLWW